LARGRRHLAEGARGAIPRPAVSVSGGHSGGSASPAGQAGGNDPHSPVEAGSRPALAGGPRGGLPGPGRRQMANRYVGHRGGAAQWPENSMTAFRNAIAAGARVLELDVHLAADGTVAVIHDSTLDRTTSGHGPVGRATAADLARARLRGRDGVFTD